MFLHPKNFRVFFIITVVLLEYIFSDTWITGRKKNQIMEKEMETILAINLPFFSIYWNRKLAGS